MSQYVIEKVIEDVGIIKLNRPERLNAWNEEMRNSVSAALNKYDVDDRICAVVLTGSGDRGFCAGQDFQESKGFDQNRAERWVEEFRKLYGIMRSLSKPFVAALNGVAAGSGFQAALLADIRVAHSDVKMGQPEINSGIASITGPWIMKEMLGLSRTTELTLTGRLMSADECHMIGLIHKIVPKDQVLKESVKIAKEIGAKSPTALRVIKKHFYEMTQEGFEKAFDAAVKHHRETFASGEPQVKMTKFLKE